MVTTIQAQRKPEQQTGQSNDWALVAEGGGQRGIFTAGVLDAWLEQNFDPFSILIGTSAGAQNITSYLARQKQYAYQAITQLTADQRFFKFSRAMARSQHLIDLDWYFQQVAAPDYALDVDAAMHHSEGRQVYLTATRMPDREACFLKPDRKNWLAALKASSAIPLLYREPVEVNGMGFLDGGLSAPLPVEEAYRRGARKIVVIRTIDESAERAAAVWGTRLKNLICVSSRCPKVLDLMSHHEAAYRASMHFIHNAPRDAEIIQIFPSRALESRMLASAPDALDNDYAMGLEQGYVWHRLLSKALEKESGPLAPTRLCSQG